MRCTVRGLVAMQWAALHGMLKSCHHAFDHGFFWWVVITF
jgi:hypothetical protein